MVGSRSYWDKAILNKAVQLLAQRNHSEVELKQKLWRYFSIKIVKSNSRMPLNMSCPLLLPDQLKIKIHDAIKFCQKKNWHDEKEFVTTYATARQRRGYGYKRIERELKARGVQEALIHSILPKQETPENLLIMADLVQKRYGAINTSDKKQKQKIYRFLLNRGLSLQNVNNVYYSIKN